MQAAVHVPDTPELQIVNDFDIPKPGPNQVLLKIQASGLCHTDVLFSRCLQYTDFYSTLIYAGLPTEPGAL